MTSHRPRRKPVVWEPGPRGWRVVRARVPGSPRSGRPSESERVPRPPEHRHAEAAEVPVVRELVQLRGLVELVELAGDVATKFGRWPVVLLAAYALTRKRKR